MNQTYLCIIVCASCTYSVACEFHPHWISCRTDKGAGRECGWNRLHPHLVAIRVTFGQECQYWVVARLPYQCNEISSFYHLVYGCFSWVQRFIYLLFLAIKKESDLSQGSLSCVDGMYNWQTKRFSFMYISSGMVSLFPRLEKASSIGRLAFFRLF